MCVIALVVMSLSQVEVIKETEIVEVKDVHHGAIEEIEIATIEIRTKNVKEIGLVSSVAIVTSPLEPNVTDVDATKMAQVARIHPIVLLEETTLGASGD